MICIIDGNYAGIKENDQEKMGIKIFVEEAGKARLLHDATSV